MESGTRDTGIVTGGYALAEGGHNPYVAHRVSLADMSSGLGGEVQAFLGSRPGGCLEQVPEWVRLVKRAQAQHLYVVLVRDRAGALVGILPFLVHRWPLECRLGEVRLWRLPLRRLTVLGEENALPEDNAAFRAAFAALLDDRDLRFDALWFEMVPVGGALHEFLTSDGMVRGRLRGFLPSEPRPHHRLRLGESFEQYLHGFSKKHRQNLTRAARKLV